MAGASGIMLPGMEMWAEGSENAWMNEIEHDREAGRFSLRAEGLECVADYRLEEGRMIFTHTYVPPALRGKGWAGKLIEAGLSHAEREGWKVVPQCSYVGTYLERHPEYAHLRVPEA